MYGMMSPSLIPHSMSSIFHRVCLEHLLLMSLLRPVTKLLFLIVLSIIGAQIRMAKTLIGLLGISPN